MSKSKISKSESIPEFEESIKNMSEQDKNRIDSSIDKMEKLQQAAEDTRQEIIDKYEGNREYPSYYHEHNIHLMMQEYAEQYWNGWVSVEDRLPKQPDKNMAVCVSVYCKDEGQKGIVLQAVFALGKFYPALTFSEEGIAGDFIQTPTHWQPLPSPPKTDNQ